MTAITPLLKFITKGMSGVEIGVQQGLSSREILAKGVYLLCVDPWKPQPNYLEGKMLNDFPKWKDAAMKNLAPWMIGIGPGGGLATIHVGSSSEAAVERRGEYDFVFIDGNHQYEYVRLDIDLWYPMIRKGGFICGHDYFPSMGKHHQVKEAVDEWAAETGIPIESHGDCWLAWVK